MLIKVKSHHLRAVQACVHSDDPRPSLKGWFVDRKDSVLVGTDGHILTTVPFEVLEPPDDHELTWVFKSINIGARKSVFDVWIDTNAKRASYMSGRTSKEVKIHPFDATFPDWRRVVPLLKRSNPGLRSIGVETQQLAKVQAALQAKGAKISFGKDDKQIIDVEWIGDDVHDVRTFVMPVHC